MEDLFDSYNGYINTFCENLKGEVEKVISRYEDYGGKVHICAISRKMPKLLDILHEDLKEIWDKLIIITEITLPFVDWNNMKAILLADDAIYYGSTFSAVYNQIKGYSPNIHIIPICCIRASEVMLSFETDLKTTNVERAVGHYFVNCLSVVFRKQCTPFEVEFPVFQAQLPKGCSIDIDVLDKTLRKAKFNIYHINNHVKQILERRKENNNFTELGIDLSEDGKTCKKIRLYIKGSQVLVSYIYTPLVFQEDLTRKNSLWGTIYEKPWCYIYDKLNSSHKDMNVYKTLCVALNFLYSMDAFICIQETLSTCMSLSNTLHEEISFSLDIRELQLLFGYDIADYIYKWYNEVNAYAKSQKKQIPAHQVIDGISMVKEYLPQDFKLIDYYNTVRNRLLRNFKKVSDALMVMFYVQNALLDKTNRMFYLLSSERLKYGHTYKSILSVLENAGIDISEKQNVTDVHRWIDARIDCATVVPQYIVSENYKGEKYWHRVFRSGENEVYFISHWVRLSIAVLNKIREETGRVFIDKEYFTGLLSLIYKEFKLDEYFYDCSIIKYDSFCYLIYLKTETGLESVFDVLCNLEIISEIDEGIQTRNEDLLDKELESASVIPQNVMGKIMERLTQLHHTIPYIDNYRYYIPYFNARLFERENENKKDVNVLDFLFDFMNSATNERWSPQQMANEFVKVKKECYILWLSNITKSDSWISSHRNLKDEDMEKEIGMLLQADTEKQGDMVLYKIIENTIFGIEKNQLLFIIKSQNVSKIYFLMDYIAGAQEQPTCDMIYNRILKKGKDVWIF